ncbi:uncharacterized protein N7529_006502 [Penicillium soppii]|uniref:uncharacterized protein n=1 Tax=Penicillium soppii TaxID=69789 RepID=UPI00254887E1|nr:uncharacterized protein N7529_006502 [Penicillium soppii]KAJ5864586.1 hypothetical protein N7529_006502 [Penicillium soppii]
MEPLETSGHGVHAKGNKSQNYQLQESQNDSRSMQDPLEPSSSDVDERMTSAQDFKDAIEKGNILDGDSLRHAKPQSSTAYNEPSKDDIDISWRPDPSGHPRRTF